nr:peroxidase-like [Onthophagus taurus]XP_022905518.1 peroxidase-like [Onthophagus taurus]
MTMDYYLIPLISLSLLLSSIASSDNLNNDTFKNVQISQDELQDTIDFAKLILGKSENLETRLNWAGVNLKKTNLEFKLFLQNAPDQDALNQAYYAYLIKLTTNQLKQTLCRRLNLVHKNEECLNLLSTIKLDEYIPYCSIRSENINNTCLNNPIYRSIDGSCNHKNNPIKGKSQTAYKRLVNSTIYWDGLEFITSSYLSPRKISLDLFQNQNNLDGRFTFSLIEWAEFIFNDLFHTVSRKMVHNSKNITCCAPDGYKLPPRHQHPFCLPIEIPDNDDFYSKFNIKCLSYVRSLPAISDDCTLGRIEQMNQATHYLDASNIYGSDSKKSHDLRLHKDGFLKFQVNNGMFLPFTNSNEMCNSTCFDGAEPRLNSQPLLTTLHTLFLREHNRIAKELKNINQDWNDNELFEETRRIVIAEIQRITYKEFLPIILGENFYKKTINDNLEKQFDEDVDPRVSNSFATAASKFFITAYDETINLYDENNNLNEKIDLKKIFGEEFLMDIKNFDKFLMTLSTQPIQRVDLNVPNNIKNHFLEKNNYGLDFISLIIQRGRDHGLLPYTNYRELCGLKEVNTFDDLYPLISNETIKNLMKLYNNPKKIDLFVGGVAETSYPDGILGPTFSCIIAEQFLRSQRGDKYFYTNKNQPKPFTHDQLKEIENVSLAGIFCVNSNIKRIQRNVFKMTDFGNEKVDCSEIPKINLEYWSENMIF